MTKLSGALKKGNMRLFARYGNLHIDYYVGGKRVKKSTGLKDTKENRRKIEREVFPRLATKILTGDFSKSEEHKFGYCYEKFILEHQDDKSFHNRVYIYKKVNAHFKDFNVEDVKRQSIKDYLNSLGIKESSQKDHLGCIKGVLDIALDDEVISKNVAVGIRFKRQSKEPVNPFTPEEVKLLLDKSNGMLRNYLGIALYTGMRSGEILGLMHSDVSGNTININRSISKGNITTPKTLGSIRVIPMFESVKPFIEDQKSRSESLYLFDYNKKFIRDVSYFKRRWHALIELCGIEYRKIYNTRHTFITMMLNSEKFKIMEIAAIVGHTSPEMIMKNYAGFIKHEHLKIDTTIEIFGNHTGTSINFEDLKNG